MKKLLNWLDRLPCRVGFHDWMELKSERWSTIAIPGGSMSDREQRHVSVCRKCDKRQKWRR